MPDEADMVCRTCGETLLYQDGKWIHLIPFMKCFMAVPVPRDTKES